MSDQIALLLMGTKGLAALSGIDGHRVAYVVVGRDSGQEDHAEELFAACAARGIPAFERNAHRPPATHLICASWRWIERDPSITKIILHDSLLPRLRGWNPLVTALINGDSEIGVTSVLADAEVDHGAILGQKRVRITYPLRIADAIASLMPGYRELTSEALDMIRAGNLQGKPQDDTQATYSLWRDKQDYVIDWNWPAEQIVRFIDATGHPYLGASTHCQLVPVRIFAAEALPDVIIENRCPGKLLAWRDGCPVIVCGRGLLRITVAHSDDGHPMNWPQERIRIRFGRPNA